MLQKVQSQLQPLRLTGGPKMVLVGVSGGADSVCLLDQLVQTGGAKLHVCHLNHQLRGAASDGDERFVRRLAKKYGLPCHVARVDVRAKAKGEKLSMEAAAREARLRFFAETAKKLGLRHPVVGLAHHADDQVETFLLRLLRGAGARGLSGMRSQTQIGGLTIVRPLLEVTRAEILEYLRERKLKYRTDASNGDVSFLRNRIRHKLLPLLEREYNPGIRAVLLRTAEILGEEDRYLDEEAEKVGKKLKTLKKMPLALRRRAVRMRNLRATFAEVERMMVAAGVDGDKFGNAAKENRGYNAGQEDTKITARIMAKPKDFLPKAQRTKPNAWVEFFDADQVGAWTVRTWRAGDRMRPLGMDSEKKLQDLFVDTKIPAVVRRKIRLVVAANNKIAWVVGVRMSEEFKVTERTRRLLRLSVRRA